MKKQAKPPKKLEHKLEPAQDRQPTSFFLFQDLVKRQKRARWLRALGVYVAGVVGLLVAYRTGLLQEVVRAAGWVTYAVAVLVVAHVVTSSASILGRGGSLVKWLAKIDATILTVGFLGKLYAIAVVVGAAGSASDPTSIAAGIAAINSGISQALFSTMAGLAVAAWTHCVTMIAADR